MSEVPARFVGLECPRCGEDFDPGFDVTHCQRCDSLLEPRGDLSSISLTRKELERRPFTSMWRYEAFLPFESDSAVSIGEGATPLVACPNLADSLGVGELWIKLEGANPTGTFKDRGQSMAVTAATLAGADTIALASAGNAGHAAAAYGARAGLDVRVYLPARSGFSQKALVNVHGADLTVVQGRLPEAGAAFREALTAHPDWCSVATDDTPFRREGKKTMFLEIAEQLDWASPDAIVYPTGGGVGLLGMAKGADELTRLGWIDRPPRFFAAQSTGCAPVVEAFHTGREEIHPIEQPDTICGGIEVPNPTAGSLILEAIRDSDGGAVASDDDEILDAALLVAETEGIAMAPTAGATVSGTRSLVADGELGTDDVVVLVATGSGLKEADVLRSQLMSKGV